MLLILFTTVIVVAVFLYNHFTKYNNYWKERNVPGPEPTFFFGNIKDVVLRKRATCEIFAEICDKYPDEKVIGIFMMRTPELLVTDLDMINQICIKDFDVFVDRGLTFSEKKLGLNISHATAENWRVLRKQFTPLFSSGKLKNLTYLMTELGDKLVDYVEKITKKQLEQDGHTLGKKFTQSAIAAFAFGIDVDSFSDKLFNTLHRIDQRIVNNTYAHEFEMMYPGILTRIGISLFPKEVTQFFFGLTKQIIAQRKGELTNRNDFMGLLLTLRKAKQISSQKKANADTEWIVEVTDELISGQSIIYFFVGNESAAVTTGAMLRSLALHPDIQEKVVAELQQVLEKHGGQLTYDAVADLTYMEKVLNETLRLNIVTEYVRRCARIDYKMPGTNVTIKKGQNLLIPINVIHKNPKYYPNPEVFDPERFSPENVATRQSCSFLPFGLGPRQCIGLRFARLQVKICVAKLLANFRVEPSRKTKKQLKYVPARLVQMPIGGYPLHFIRRQVATIPTN